MGSTVGLYTTQPTPSHSAKQIGVSPGAVGHMEKRTQSAVKENIEHKEEAVYTT